MSKKRSGFKQKITVVGHGEVGAPAAAFAARTGGDEVTLFAREGVTYESTKEHGVIIKTAPEDQHHFSFEPEIVVPTSDAIEHGCIRFTVNSGDVTGQHILILTVKADKLKDPTFLENLGALLENNKDATVAVVQNGIPEGAQAGLPAGREQGAEPTASLDLGYSDLRKLLNTHNVSPVTVVAYRLINKKEYKPDDSRKMATVEMLAPIHHDKGLPYFKVCAWNETDKRGAEKVAKALSDAGMKTEVSDDPHHDVLFKLAFNLAGTMSVITGLPQNRVFKVPGVEDFVKTTIGKLQLLCERMGVKVLPHPEFFIEKIKGLVDFYPTIYRDLEKGARQKDEGVLSKFKLTPSETAELLDPVITLLEHYDIEPNGLTLLRSELEKVAKFTSVRQFDEYSQRWEDPDAEEKKERRLKDKDKVIQRVGGFLSRSRSYPEAFVYDPQSGQDRRSGVKGGSSVNGRRPQMGFGDGGEDRRGGVSVLASEPVSLDGQTTDMELQALIESARLKASAAADLARVAEIMKQRGGRGRTSPVNITGHNRATPSAPVDDSGLSRTPESPNGAEERRRIAEQAAKTRILGDKDTIVAALKRAKENLNGLESGLRYTIRDDAEAKSFRRTAYLRIYYEGNAAQNQHVVSEAVKSLHRAFNADLSNAVQFNEIDDIPRVTIHPNVTGHDKVIKALREAGIEEVEWAKAPLKFRENSPRNSGAFPSVDPSSFVSKAGPNGERANGRL